MKAGQQTGPAVRAGRGMQWGYLGKNLGTLLRRAPERQWTHPWAVAVMGWGTGKDKRTHLDLLIKPGFVNGVDPLAYGQGATGGEVYQGFERSMRGASALGRIGGARGEVYRMGGGTTRQAEGTEPTKEAGWHALLRGPVVRIGAWLSDAYHPFFDDKDVRKEAKVTWRDGMPSLDVTPGSGTGQDSGSRLLVGQDFWLSQARATYQMNVTAYDATGFSGSIVEYSPSFDTNRLRSQGARPRIHQGAWVEPVKPTFADRLAGLYGDDGEDKQRLFTVYALSPPNPSSPEPGPDWEIWVQHRCWWNVNHAGRNIPPKTLPPATPFFSPLAFGLANLPVNQFIGLQQDLLERVFNAFQNDDNEGRFWTA